MRLVVRVKVAISMIRADYPGLSRNAWIPAQTLPSCDTIDLDDCV